MYVYVFKSTASNLRVTGAQSTATQSFGCTAGVSGCLRASNGREKNTLRVVCFPGEHVGGRPRATTKSALCAPQRLNSVHFLAAGFLPSTVLPAANSKPVQTYTRNGAVALTETRRDASERGYLKTSRFVITRS